jgi:hypothetical protein
MLAHAPRRPFSLHALVAEAKRRARRRRVLLLVALIALGGAAGGAVVVTHPFGWLQPSASAAEYRPGGLVTCGGCAAIGVGAPPVTVSAAPGGATWAVGTGVAWRWDGRAWQNVPLPSVAGTNLRSVAASGPHDAWAVGYRESEQGVYSSPAIAHWNGVRWSVGALPGLTAATLSSVSAAGPHDVWAAGVISTAKSDREFWRKAQPLLLHWDGVAWRRQSLPWATPRMSIDKVVATGQSSVWVVPSAGQRQPLLEHWNGSVWRAVPAAFGRKDPVVGFSALSGSDAWAVGSYATDANGGEGSRPLAAHWNGSTWRFTPVPSNPTHNTLLANVVAVRDDDAWAVGETQQTGPNEAFGPTLVLLHWDGSSWTVTPGSAQSYFFASPTIAASANGNAWAITNCGDDNIVLGWNGARWTTVPHPRDQRWLMHGTLTKGPIKSCASSPRG